MLDVCSGFQYAMFKMIEWIMAYFPIGIFALTTCSFATYGVTLFQSYLQVAACVICGILAMIGICYPLMLWLLCRVNPYPVLWALREPILTAFVTRSSAATLPVSMRTVQEKFHVRKELSSFTLSLGATINMDGVCIHLPVFVILAANLFGLQLSMVEITTLCLTILLASIGAGGIPGGSVFLLFMVLESMGLQADQVTLIVTLALGINPILDMFETCCNVTGDNVCTYIVAKNNHMIEESQCE
jgi:Na+/H+-dicarboxylate symporter